MLMIFYGENHIQSLHKIFEIGSVNKKAFRYLGLYLEEGYSNIVFSQSSYIDSIESLKLDGKKDKKYLLNETKVKKYS